MVNPGDVLGVFYEPTAARSKPIISTTDQRSRLCCQLSEVRLVSTKMFPIPGKSYATKLLTSYYSVALKAYIQPACAKPTVIDNGNIEPDGNFFREGQQVNYKCLVGHRLTGSPELTCGDNGSWKPSGGKVSCERISCKEPTTSANVQRIGSDFQYGSSIRYTCHSGYEHKSGDMVRTCQEDGTWSGKDPICGCENKFTLSHLYYC